MRKKVKAKSEIHKQNKKQTGKNMHIHKHNIEKNLQQTGKAMATRCKSILKCLKCLFGENTDHVFGFTLAVYKRCIPLLLASCMDMTQVLY